MPIGKYYTYKCTKCGYQFTRYEPDTRTPVATRPKCGGKMEVISSSLYKNPLQRITDFFGIFMNSKKV